MVVDTTLELNGRIHSICKEKTSILFTFVYVYFCVFICVYLHVCMQCVCVNLCGVCVCNHVCVCVSADVYKVPKLTLGFLLLIAFHFLFGAESLTEGCCL